MNTRKKIMFRVWDSYPEWIITVVGWICCKIWGHEPVADQCDKPEHDFCSWCMKIMPFQAPRRTEV